MSNFVFLKFNFIYSYSQKLSASRHMILGTRHVFVDEPVKMN